jgi:predicted enzyme related to lactoylglutathione lyase
MDDALRFDAVFYYVTDLDRSVAFYTTVLGLSLSSRDVVARFHLDGVLIELVPTTDTRLVGGTGNARLTLAAGDLHQAAQVLRSRGVAVSPIRRVENGFLATFKDPDGNELVLWQYLNA